MSHKTIFKSALAPSSICMSLQLKIHRVLNPSAKLNVSAAIVWMQISHVIVCSRRLFPGKQTSGQWWSTCWNCLAGRRVEIRLLRLPELQHSNACLLAEMLTFNYPQLIFTYRGSPWKQGVWGSCLLSPHLLHRQPSTRRFIRNTCLFLQLSNQPIICCAESHADRIGPLKGCKIWSQCVWAWRDGCFQTGKLHSKSKYYPNRRKAVCPLLWNPSASTSFPFSLTEANSWREAVSSSSVLPKSRHFSALWSSCLL